MSSEAVPRPGSTMSSRRSAGSMEPLPSTRTCTPSDGPTQRGSVAPGRLSSWAEPWTADVSVIHEPQPSVAELRVRIPTVPGRPASGFVQDRPMRLNGSVSRPGISARSPRTVSAFERTSVCTGPVAEALVPLAPRLLAEPEVPGASRKTTAPTMPVTTTAAVVPHTPLFFTLIGCPSTSTWHRAPGVRLDRIVSGSVRHAQYRGGSARGVIYATLLNMCLWTRLAYRSEAGLVLA